MAVIWVVPRPENDGTDSTSGGGSASLYYLAKCDTKAVTPFTVLAHPDVPEAYSVHPDDITLYVDSRTAKQRKDSPYFWDITIKYAVAGSIGGPQQNPLLEPAVITFDTVERKIVLPQDLSDTPKQFANVPFGEILEEAPEWDRGAGVFNIERNEASFDSYSLCEQYLHTVCEHEFLGWPKLTQKMHRISSRSVTDVKQQLVYARTTYEIHVRNDGWHEYRRNLSYKLTRDGFNTMPMDDRGNVDPLPVEIKENGELFVVGVDDEEDRYILDFQGYREISWYGLGF